MQARGYCRVSTDRQARDGESLAAQRDAIERYCAARGLQLARVHVDEGWSASLPLGRRPAGRELLDALDAGHVDAIVVIRWDRAFRDVMDGLSVHHRIEQAGAELHLVRTGGLADASTPHGRAMMQMMGVYAELELAQTRERTREVLAHLRRQGRVYGPVPYGYVAVDGYLQEHPAEIPILRAMRRMRAREWSYSAIARALDRAGYRTRTGTPWTRQRVRQILSRYPTDHDPSS